MQISPTNPLAPRSGRFAAVRALVVALAMVGVGGILGWILLETPIILSLMPAGRGSPGAIAAGITAWVLAIAVPASLLVFGMARIAFVLEIWTGRFPRRPASTLRQALAPGRSAVADLVLPDGRHVHELLVGPFGAVVIGDVPPPTFSRTDGLRWELMSGRNNWVPVEPPAERAARDADRLRSWFVAEDRDFVVTVHAVLATDDPRVRGTAACPVIGTQDLAAWVDALPAQKSLTPTRLDRLHAMVKAAAAGKTVRH
jgi:hypothetical protein